VDVDDSPSVGGIDSYESTSSQIQSSYDTRATFASSIDFADPANAMVSYADTTTYLNGIGQWVEDQSSLASTWTAWQDPDVLLQHASRCRVASTTLKPHVEEAMNYFHATFYSAGGGTPGYQTVEHR
jgi:hypothetical protein